MSVSCNTSKKTTNGKNEIRKQKKKANKTQKGRNTNKI